MIQFVYRFVLTVLLFVFSLESVYAFNIIPAPNAALKSFVPSEAYEVKDGLKGVVTRQPISFTSLPRGGTEGFLAELATAFPAAKGWTFLAAAQDLQGSFSVTAYNVFFNGTVTGGGFAFDYIPAGTDPLNKGNAEIHWIQRIVSNHKRRSSHGTPENRIDVRTPKDKETRPDVPFYDVIPKGDKRFDAFSRSLPPHYEFDAGRNDAENNHKWNAEVYLVSINKNAPKNVTIYNGVSWGWENIVEAVTNR
ncbi:MAG: hypothetical protein A2X83_11965 [Desulfuromonadales bacterium GWD2_54_10]|nr:MAG: hypothetical protein A2X83_11965 [Desulfuromonadales bacterium GWD2_54_10]